MNRIKYVDLLAKPAARRRQYQSLHLTYFAYTNTLQAGETSGEQLFPLDQLVAFGMERRL